MKHDPLPRKSLERSNSAGLIANNGGGFITAIGIDPAALNPF